MNNNPESIPNLSSEDEEREFWATHDSTEYINWSRAERNPIFSCLKPYTKDKTSFDVDQTDVLH